MHESTVSRVTSNKFMATPRGIFELKYFFTHAVGGSRGGDVHSAESVRHRIKALIEAETAADVLSDDGIVELLQRKASTSPGVLWPSIARRWASHHRSSGGGTRSAGRP